MKRTAPASSVDSQDVVEKPGGLETSVEDPVDFPRHERGRDPSGFGPVSGAGFALPTRFDGGGGGGHALERAVPATDTSGHGQRTDERGIRAEGDCE